MSKKEEILLVSGNLFRKKGYKNTSMVDISAQLSIEASSMYNHISSKNEILSILLLGVANKFKDGIEDIDNSSYTPVEKIKELIALHIRITTENYNAVALLVQDWNFLKEPNYSQFVEIRTNYALKFTNIIQQGIDEDQIININAEILFQSIISSLRWLYHWYEPEKKFSKSELTIQITKLLTNGFVK